MCAQKQIIMQSLSEGEKHALIASHQSVAVCVTDFNLNLEWASEAFYTLVGCDNSLAKGQVLSKLLFKEDKLPQNFLALINRVGLENQAEAEFTCQDINGSTRCIDLNIAIATTTNQRPVGYIVYLNDNTQQRKQQEEIERSRSEIAEMFENTVVPMCYNEPSGKFFKVNKAFCELFECTSTDLIGKDYIDLHFHHFSKEEKRKLRLEANEFLQSNRVYRKEIKSMSLGGHLRVVEAVMKNVLVGEKQLVSVYLIDKTEKRDFESRILEQNKRLKEFAFLTSHKLRQPLANILGLIELVKSESQSQQDVTITFETLRMLTGQLDDVVHQMSDALTELDMEAEKSLFFNEPEETGINEIWIVDDDQVITYITERLLHNADPSLKVSGYLSAKMALEKLRLDNDCPDVLLLDINMPGISGWEFLDELNKLGRFVNVYMYSSSIDPEDVKRARAYPMVREFLSKPLDMKTINHLLDMPVLHRKVS
jgi:PAS domain S-box-containing protein